ncbi:uncharacterized protein LOC135430058 [Drosophila montana]|uniref:uncharacterized protein LOC135430056 n=1 Tax=Drosophila montana TaxID=40370 RepID=UPI00313B6B1F
MIEARVRVNIQRSQSNVPSHSILVHHEELLAPTVIVTNRTRLPELKLATFSGGYTEYSDFIAMFRSVGDKETELSNIEQMQHLRSRFSALDSVRSLEFSGANYRVALDILKRRFSNKSLVFQANINEILGLKRVDSESASKLLEFSDNFNSHIRALQTLGSFERISGCIIVQTLL